MIYIFPYGGVHKKEVEDALQKAGLDFIIPEDVMQFWVDCGGGDFFETETFLYPLQDDRFENIFSFNKNLWKQGLPNIYMCIYTGLFGYAVIQKNKPMLYLLKEDFSFQNTSTLSDLIKLLNEEYAERYGYIIEY